MTSYRAAYYVSSSQGGVVLTSPEQATLSDAALIEAAVAEAYNGDIVSKDGDDPAKMCGNRLSEEDLRAGLRIGEWHP